MKPILMIVALLVLAVPCFAQAENACVCPDAPPGREILVLDPTGNAYRAQIVQTLAQIEMALKQIEALRQVPPEERQKKQGE